MKREPVRLEEVSQLLERSDYRTVVSQGVRIDVFDENGLLAHIDFYRTSILVSLYSGDRGIVIELVRQELKDLLPILALARVSPVADLYLSMYENWSESLRYTPGKNYLCLGIMRITPVGDQICVNMLDMSFMFESVTAFNDNLWFKSFDRVLDFAA